MNFKHDTTVTNILPSKTELYVHFVERNGITEAIRIGPNQNFRNRTK